MNKQGILNKINNYENGAKILTVFTALAGRNLADCKDVDAKCLGILNLKGISEEMTLTYLVDAYVIVTKSSNSVLTENGVFLGKMMGCPELVVSEKVLELFGNDVEDVELESHKEKDNSDDWNDTDVLEGNEETTELDSEEEAEEVQLDNNSVIYSSFIKNKVSELLECYSSLYKVCYENSRPKGILTPEGLFTLSGKVQSTDEESRAELSMVYKVIQDVLGPLDGVTRFSSKVSPKGIEEGNGIPLYPNYHLANMYGYFGGRSQKSTSYKEFSSYIEKRTINILKKIVQDLPDDIKANNREEVEAIILRYIANIKTCILVDDYKPGVVLKLRICVDSAVHSTEYDALNTEIFKKVIDSGYLFKRQAVVDCPARENDVIYMNFIVDSNSYYNSPLFAYEALPILQEQGIELSWNNILIGKDIKDELVFGKFGAEQKTIYNIMAGSGSGKGVMTLSLLASALAANIPVLYADSKPDMARVLWNVAGGREVLAFDGDEQGTLEAIESRYNIYEYFNMNVPTALKEYLSNKGLQKKFVKTYSYMRCIHLAYLISVMRKEQGVSPDDYILFIFDEIGRVAEQVKDLTVELRGEGDTPKSGFIYERTQALKAEKAAKEAVAMDESIKFAKDFVNYCIGVMNKIVTAKTAELRLSNSKLLFIWQPDWVKKAGLANITSVNNKYYFMSVLYKLVSDSNTVKFAGKGSENAGPIGMAEAYNVSETNAQLFDEFRYFALAESGEITSSSKVFRPFLLLNDSSPNSAAKCVATNPLAYDKIYRNGNENDIIPEIGFPEYVNKLLGGNIQEPLCRSWGIALDAIESLGYARDLYKFMYDVSDMRLNLANGVDDLDSTTVSNGGEKQETYSDLLKVASQEDDFSEDEDTSEEARMKMTFGDYTKEDWEYAWEDEPEEFIEDEEVDIFGDLDESSISNTSASSFNLGYNQGGEFEATVREAEALLRRLSELGIDVDVKSSPVSSEPLQRVNNRSTFEFEDANVFNNEEDTYEVLFNKVTEDIVKTFGGLQRFRQFRIKGGSIGVNGYYYRCKVSSNSKNIPYDIRRQLNSGNIQSLFDYRLLFNMPNLKSIEVDSIDFVVEYLSPLVGERFKSQGNNMNESFASNLFKAIPSLEWCMFGEDNYIYRAEVNPSYSDIKFQEAQRRKYIADTIQNACFKGAAKSWEFNGKVLQSNQKWYVKALGLAAGTTGTVVSGTAGATTFATRKIGEFGKNLYKGIKDLMNS